MFVFYPYCTAQHSTSSGSSLRFWDRVFLSRQRFFTRDKGFAVETLEPACKRHKAGCFSHIALTGTLLNWERGKLPPEPSPTVKSLSSRGLAYIVRAAKARKHKKNETMKSGSCCCMVKGDADDVGTHRRIPLVAPPPPPKLPSF